MNIRTKWQQTPHQKLLRAYEEGRGLSLSYADVFMLVQTAVRHAAENDDANQKAFELRK